MNGAANDRILIVDDNRAIHDDFRKILTATNDRSALDAAAAGLFGEVIRSKNSPTFLVDSAYHGEEGALMVQRAAEEKRPYAMAFVDMRMPPGWDGLETIVKLWEIEPDLQIVICTANSDYSLDQIQEKISAADRLLILKKPFDSVEVMQLACALTAKWQLEQISRANTAELQRMVESRTEDLVKANEQLRSHAQLIDLAHDAIMVFDLNHCVRFWNAGAERLYGWTQKEVEGRNIVRWVYPEPDVSDETQKKVLENGEWSGELQHLTKKEEEIIVSSRWTLMRDDFGDPESILVINTDITKRKNLEDQFFRAQRLESIGTLASGLAHDLNNVLAPILMCVRLLRRKLPEDQMKDVVETIEASASRGAQIVRQVLTFGRGVEGERCQMSMAKIIEEIVQIARETFPKNIRIEHDVRPRLASIIGDLTQWHQVLLNLCVNARDAMPKGGLLRIYATNLVVDESYASMTEGLSEGSYIALEVSDTGIGIPPKIAERIFDPFFTTKPLGQGTGLGLSTVLGIVKSHGGTIELKSHAGSGTTFRILVPALGLQETTETDPVKIAFLLGNGETVLIVDDEENIRTVVRSILELHGYRTMVAGDGSEALAIFAQHSSSIDLVVTDITMPYIDGLILIRSLRRMRPDLPIVASTGLAEKGRIAELKALGLEYILDKPYSAELLLQTVNQELVASREKRSAGEYPASLNEEVKQLSKLKDAK